MAKKNRALTVVQGAKVAPPEQALEDAPRCCARKRYCDCGHRFTKEETVKSDHKLSERRQKGFNRSRLGHCPECIRTRPLCGQPAVKGRSVCRMHGGKAGRRPALPLMKLSEKALDRIAALKAAEDDSLSDEFYALKHFIQEAIAEFDEEITNKMEHAERTAALLDRATGVQEKQARLRMLVPPGQDIGKLNFEDPRVALMIKEKMRQSYEDAVKGTLQVMIDTVGEKLGGDLLAKMLKALPERFRNYIVVEKAMEVEAEVIEDDKPETN